MIELDTQITDRIPAAATRPGISAETARRIENMRAATAKAKENAEAAISVRMLGNADADSLRRLAGRDSAGVPSGRLLGAETDGVLIAVLGIDSGTVVADPFRATGSAVELLKLRARQLGGTQRGRRFRLPHLPRARGALAGSPPGGSNLLQL